MFFMKTPPMEIIVDTFWHQNGLLFLKFCFKWLVQKWKLISNVMLSFPICLKTMDSDVPGYEEGNTQSRGRGR